MKKLLTLLLTLVLCAGSFFGCSTAKDDDDNKYANRPVKIILSYSYGGYGEGYMDALAKDFMDYCDSDIYLKPVANHAPATMRDNIQAKTPDGDICFMSVDMFGYSQVLENLDTIYSSKPIKENGQEEETTIAAKIGDKMTNYYTESTGKYQLPGTSMWGYNWVYNKTVLDNAYGTDNYTLPRTTNELLAFGSKIKTEKGIYLTSAALADKNGGDYLTYAFQTWFAQMTGLEGYERFFDGEYYDTGSSEWKFSEASPLIFSTNKQAIESAYNVAYELCKKSNNYLHNASESLTYIDNDKVFAGAGYSLAQAKTAFLYTGAWYENEISEFVKLGIVGRNEYRAIKMPVISDIVKRLSVNITDAMLSALIDKIDSGKTFADITASDFNNITEDDFNIIKEARSMYTEQVCAEVVVPKIKDESKRPYINKVLRYLASDRAQKVVTKATGGVPILGLGYTPDYNSLQNEGFSASSFIKSYYESIKGGIAIDFACRNKIFKQSTDFTWFRAANSDPLPKQVYGGTAHAPTQIYNKTMEYYEGNVWTNMVSTYKKAIGID